jgi:hypothetical protein
MSKTNIQHPDPDRLRALAYEIDEMQKRHNRELESLKRRILIEAGVMKVLPGPAEFVGKHGARFKIGS